MDKYSNIYTSTFDTTKKTIQSNLIKKLKYQYKHELNLDDTFKDLNKLLSKISNRQIHFLNTDLDNIYEDFQDGINKYSKNHIQNCLNKDLLKKYKLKNLHTNISYENIVQNISVIKALTESKQLINKNKNIYCILAEQNNFDRIKLIEISENVKYKKLFNQTNGNVNFNETDKPGKEKLSNINPSPITKSEIELEMGNIDSDEKFLLLNVCHNHDLPLAEFAKIFNLTNGIQDYDMLSGKPVSKINFYTKLNKGIDYYNSGNSKKYEKIDTLIKKIKVYNLKKTKEALIKIRLNIK